MIRQRNETSAQDVSITNSVNKVIEYTLQEISGQELLKRNGRPNKNPQKKSFSKIP